MKYAWDVVKLAIIVLFSIFIFALVTGCAAQNPFEEGSQAYIDRHAYIMHKRAVDVMNYENCTYALLQHGIPMVHMDHRHDKQAKVPVTFIKMDLAFNNCYKALGIYWTPYADEYLIEGDADE